MSVTKRNVGAAGGGSGEPGEPGPGFRAREGGGAGGGDVGNRYTVVMGLVLA